MSSLEDICLCEFGFRVGDGRTDSNKCPVHDMTHAELLERGSYYPDLYQKQLLEEELERA